MKFLKKVKARYRYSLILLKQLVITDFKLRYQNSVLGYMWSLLRPLLLFGVLYVIFVLILKAGGDVPYFGTYLLLGLVIWNFFVEVTTGSVGLMVAKGDLLRKINFPRYIIIIANSISALINLGLNMIVIGIVMIIAGADPNLYALWFPLLVVQLYIFSLALSFFLSAVYVKYRDINFIWEVATQMLFYATPILYAFSFITDKSMILGKIMLMSPLAQIMQDMRHGLVTDKAATASIIFNGGIYKLIPILLTIVIFVVGSLYFRKQSKNFAENV